MSRKILFIDRDGTIITEPEDQQVDRIDKIQFEKNVIPALLSLQKMGFELVMVSNQDGLGTDSFPKDDFTLPHQFMLNVLESQGVQFSDILICPHFAKEGCECSKPRLGLLKSYLKDLSWDRSHSYVIGDRKTDLELADNLGVHGILYHADNDWDAIYHSICNTDRVAKVHRKTNETDISVSLNLDQQGLIKVRTGIGFFDHMLEQIAKHGGFNLQLTVDGDLHVDEHHVIEDTALALGNAIKRALGDKLGIARYGFVLPMDESLARVAIDLSGRAYFVFQGEFKREFVGGLPTELVSHFFRSLSEALLAAINIKVEGENAHHMVEVIFKAVGRALRMAKNKQGYELPSTKGVL